MHVEDGSNGNADENSFRSDGIVPRRGIVTSSTPSQVHIIKEDSPSIIVFGSVAIDLSCDFSPRDTDKHTSLSPHMHTSNIATIIPSMGGVGHNVALAAQLSSGDASVRLCSYVADDL
jgi:pseudouridine-5'-phosphate glycosidase/pseudouridine kinase